MITKEGGGSVVDYMVAPVHTIHESERLAAAERRMTELGISALPVVDDTGQLGGVITRADLLRIGHVRGTGRERFLDLPDRRIREQASSPIELASRTARMAEVARRMLRRKVHHVYVAQGRILEAVVSSRELMQALADDCIDRQIGEVIPNGTTLTVHSTDPVGLAIDRLVTSQNHEAVVVLDAGWPVGVFDRLEALAAKDGSSRTPVDQWMSLDILSVPADRLIRDVAAEAARSSPRAVLVTEGREVRGVLTRLDFAALLAA